MVPTAFLHRDRSPARQAPRHDDAGPVPRSEELCEVTECPAAGGRCVVRKDPIHTATSAAQARAISPWAMVAPDCPVKPATSHDASSGRLPAVAMNPASAITAAQASARCQRCCTAGTLSKMSMIPKIAGIKAVKLDTRFRSIPIRQCRSRAFQRTTLLSPSCCAAFNRSVIGIWIL